MAENRMNHHTAPEAPMTDEHEAFETWATSHGGLPLYPVGSGGGTRGGMFPATYWDDRTEIAWRAWANKPARALLAQAATAQPVAPEGFVLMPKTLTAENGAKSALSGEFAEKFDLTCQECADAGEVCDDCEVCGGSGLNSVDVPVEWSTIKDIYRKAVEVCAAPIQPFQAAPVAAQPAPNTYHDAYRGARDDMQEWKKRALEAEESCRKLTRALNDENGPTHMGEPVLKAQPAPMPVARNEVLEEAAEALESMIENVGDAASYDNREMYPHEVERMATVTEGAKLIRALKSDAQQVAAVSPDVLKDADFYRGIIAALAVLKSFGHPHGSTMHDAIVATVDKEQLYAVATPEDIEWAGMDAAIQSTNTPEAGK